ncbi:MAG: hypothetical protein HYY49_11820 [Ignavibacteriales bacterium]|nr:hypothetical protein [Ignavibacteriales bacterium]
MKQIRSRSALLGILSIVVPLLMIGIFRVFEWHAQYPNWKNRNGAIYSLAILAPLVGIFLGIVALISSRTEIKEESEERSGIWQRRASKFGMVLGIAGIAFVPVYLVVGLSYFATASIVANRDAIRNDLMNIAAQAYEFRLRPLGIDGGGGSYAGYELPRVRRENENATYELLLRTGDTLIILGTSAGYPGATLTAVVDANGDIVRSRYTGDFSP